MTISGPTRPCWSCDAPVFLMAETCPACGAEGWFRRAAAGKSLTPEPTPEPVPVPLAPPAPAPASAAPEITPVDTAPVVAVPPESWPLSPAEPAATAVPASVPPPAAPVAPVRPPAWPSPAPEPKSSAKGKVFAFAAVILALVAGLQLTNHGSSGSSASGSSGSNKGSAKISYPKAWDARVGPIAAFVETQRRLTFKHPVTVDFLAPPAFETEFAKVVTGEKSDADLDAAIYRLEGFIGPTFDLYVEGPKFLAGTVIGFYDPDTKRVMVKGDQMTPAVRSVLAHELTHVLQDQYFDLSRDYSGSSQADGFRATAEADADAVETAYLATLSKADRDAAQAEEDRGTLTLAQVKAFPPALVDLQGYVYVLGESFRAAVSAAGGQTAVDATLTTPPTDADLLQPSRYLNHTPVVAAHDPALKPGETEIDRTTIGAFELLELLASHGAFAPAWAGIVGYSDDQALAYERSGKTCERVDVSFASATGASQFATAAASWARVIPGATVTRSGSSVDLDACDPGPAAPTTPAGSVLERVEFRAGVLDGLNEALKGTRRVTPAQAECIATTAASNLTSAQLDLLETDPPDSQLGFLDKLAQAAGRACVR